MTSEEYQIVKTVFQAALELGTDERPAFIDEACLDNEELRREVEKLLNNYDTDFMEESDVVVDFPYKSVFSKGDKVRHFEILEQLGRGGMGEVYLAKVTTLSRNVAVKVLLSEFTADKDRANRFKLEARSASALNHQNIITIYEIGEENGRLFIITEHISGETLRSLIQKKKLGIALSIQIAEQIASALNAAHKAGIIHRDIKPENIVVKDDGLVKVLDFGLAKPMTLDSEAATNELVATKQGMIMGSVGYMSPEQARGLKVDARTDLWSLGVVLYEMLTGNPPFQADTMTDILANIIHKEPQPISDILESPPELCKIVERLLNKNVNERYQTADELFTELKTLRREIESNGNEITVSPDKDDTNGREKEIDYLIETEIIPTPIETQTSVEIAKVTKKYRQRIFFAVGILLIGTLGYFGYSYLKPERLIETSFKNTKVETLAGKGVIYSLALSPDGKYLAYVNDGIGSDSKLIVRHIETKSEKEIISNTTTSCGLDIQSFSADSNYIYFSFCPNPNSSEYTINKIAILGGEITEIPVKNKRQFSFSPDGKKLAFLKDCQKDKTCQVIVADADGKNEQVVFSTTDKFLETPVLSPDNKNIFVTFSERNEDIEINAKLGWIPADGGELKQLGNSSWNLRQYGDIQPSFAWLSDGSGIIAASNLSSDNSPQIYTISFPDGKVAGITKDSSSYMHLTMTANSNRIASIKKTTSSGIWEFDLETKASQQIMQSTNLVIGRRGFATNKENKILFVKPDGTGNDDLWQVNEDGSGEKLLVSKVGKIENLIVSTTGEYIFFNTNTFRISPAFPTNAIWQVDSDGSNLKQLAIPKTGTISLIWVSPDDDNIVFQEWQNDTTESNLKKFNLISGEIINISGDKYSPFTNGIIPSNGKYILFKHYNKFQYSGSTILEEFDGTRVGKTILKMPPEADYWVIRFSPDGNSLYYFDWSNLTDIWKYDFATRKSTKITNFNLDQISNFALSQDGKKLYIVRGNTTDEIVLIKNVE